MVDRPPGSPGPFAGFTSYRNSAFTASSAPDSAAAGPRSAGLVAVADVGEARAGSEGPGARRPPEARLPGEGEGEGEEEVEAREEAPQEGAPGGDGDYGELESSVYVFGQVVGGRGFGAGAINCSWEVKLQDTWRACMGFTSGVTFTSQHRDDDADALCVWSHPLDFHLATKSTRGWPRMTFAVRKVDPASGADAFAAYGVCALPMTSGTHAVEVPCWRASDRSSLLNDEVLRYHTGLTPELSDPQYVLDRGAVPSAALHTVGHGSVAVRFHVVLREIRFAAGLAMMQISDSMADTRVKEWLVTAKKKREDRDKARRERMVSRMQKDAERGTAQNLASYALATAKERRRLSEADAAAGGGAPSAAAARAGAGGGGASRSSLQEERQRRFERVQQRIELARGSRDRRREEGAG